MARTAIGAALGVAFIAAVVWSAFEATRIQCEICIDYKGRSACSTAQAADVGQAELQARAGACAQVSGGVTETLECDRTPASSRRCSE